MHDHSGKGPGKAPFRAYSFELKLCDNPKCGAHIIGLTKGGHPFCDIAIPHNAAPSFVQALQDLLYLQAVERDDPVDINGDEIPF